MSNPPAPTLPRRPWWLVVRLLRRATINFADELPHLLRDEPRHGRADTTEANWRASLLAVLRGVVLAPGEQAGSAGPEHPAEGDPPEG